MSASQAQILAALIAALAAVIITVTQHFSQRRNTRAIEELKNNFERQKLRQGEYLKSYLNLVMEGKEQELLAFRDLLQRTQELRDKLKGVITDLHAYDHTALAEEINALASAVAKAYAEHLLHLSQNDQQLAHTIKNTVLAIAQHITNRPPNNSRQREQRWLDETRANADQLASLQNELRARAINANTAIVESLKAELNK